MTFSGANSFRKRGWAKNLRLPTKARIRSIASSFLIEKGRIMSGIAPLGIWLFIDKVLRHQWHRAWVDDAVSMTTSAPHAEHLNVSTSSVEGVISAAPEPIITPCNEPMSLLRFRLSDSVSAAHSYRQNAQRSFPLLGFKAISVAPHCKHLTNPSWASESV